VANDGLIERAILFQALSSVTIFTKMEFCQ
jgi:hypothetical protein